MNQRFRIDSFEYDTEGLSQEGKNLVALLTFANLKQYEMSDQLALLSRAKNAYIADLKTEIVKGRTGLDLGELFSDD